MKNRKIIVLLVTLVMLVTIMSACNNDPSEPAGGGEAVGGDEVAGGEDGEDDEGEVALAPGEKEPVRFLYPGFAGELHEELIERVNAMLDADNMNIDFQPMPIGWDIWEQRVTLMFQAGEEFELVQVPEGFGPGYVQLWNMGASIRLNELIDEYGQNIKELVPQWLWDAATIDGNISTIPANWVEVANYQGGISMRRDLLIRYGLDDPHDLDSLLEVSKILQERMMEDQLYPRPAYVMMRYHEIATYQHRTYPTYPFSVFEQWLMIRQDGTVEAWVDTVEFEWDANWNHRLFTEGLIFPELLGADLPVLEADFGQGNYLFAERNLSNACFGQRRESGFEEILSTFIVFNPEEPMFRNQGVRNSNIVSSTSPNPSAAVRWHNWLYDSLENYLAVISGFEGLNYEIDEVGDMVPLHDAPTLGIASWMIGNLDLQPIQSWFNEEYVASRATYDPNAINCISIGFAFDPTPVSVQYANVLAEIPTVIYPLRAGVVSFEEGHPVAVAALRAAGIDELVDEFQRQFTAWLETR